MDARVDDTILERIRKVKSLTESSNEGEAAAAAAMLTKMLREYDLTLGDIKDRPADNQVKQTVTGAELKNKWGKTATQRIQWRVDIAQAVAKTTFCHIILYDGAKIAFIGHEKDMEVALYVYDALCNKVESLCALRVHEYCEDYKKVTGQSASKATGTEHPLRWRVSWLRGAAVSIVNHLYSEFKDWRTQPQANALVLVKGTEVQKWIDNHYGKLGKARMTRPEMNSGAYMQGVADGKGIRADRGVGAGSPTLRLGS